MQCVTARLDPGVPRKVAGWATVGEQSAGEPIWDVVATYLCVRDTVSIDKLKNMKGNPGIDDYVGEILS